jgi:hypothetical protein
MSLSVRRCAVTTISSKPLLDAVSASPVAAMDMADQASWFATAIGTKQSFIFFERIAHPFRCCCFATF